MRCKNCNYRLWQITTRQCPECGTPFRPSDFEFVPNSVRFCCPHCQQAYYGTGARHVSPREFDCVACGRRIDMDEMMLLPAEGVEEEQTDALIEMPWLTRDRPYGPVRAWLKTVWASMVRPGALIRATRPESSGWAALWFAFATQFAIMFAAVAPGLFVLFAIVGSAPGGARSSGIGWHSLLIVLSLVGFGLGVILINLIATTLLAHLALRVTGGCAFGIKRTWQATCYSSGANLLTAVPCFGPYFGWIWWVVSAILMVKDGQKVHGGRATLAVLIAPALIILAIMGSYATLIYFAVQQGSGSNLSVTYSGPGLGAGSIASALATSAVGAGGPPRHVSGLLSDGRVLSSDFMDYSFGAGKGGPGGQDRADEKLIRAWPLPTPQEQKAALAKAAEAVPIGAVAHRFGDTVAVYEGVDFGNVSDADGSSQLWLVVRWPSTLERDATVRYRVEIGRANGTVQKVRVKEFEDALKAQNRLRAKLGVPLIPHPADVTVQSPALRDDEKYAPPPDPTPPGNPVR